LAFCYRPDDPWYGDTIWLEALYTTSILTMPRPKCAESCHHQGLNGFELRAAETDARHQITGVAEPQDLVTQAMALLHQDEALAFEVGHTPIRRANAAVIGSCPDREVAG
jgi:hypothetical protein